MKRKMKGAVGIGLTLVLLVSLTVGLSAPAGAAPGTLKFTTLSLPKVGEAGDYWAYPDSDGGPIAIAADGKTLFAALHDGAAWQLMKSSDGGYAWKMLDDFRATADADTTPIVDVVVSPDYAEDLTVVVATQNFVYQSVDGGKRFVVMTQGWSGAETITDLDVALDERGRLAIMVGTTASVAGEDIDRHVTADINGTTGLVVDITYTKRDGTTGTLDNYTVAPIAACDWDLAIIARADDCVDITNIVADGGDATAGTIEILSATSGILMGTYDVVAGFTDGDTLFIGDVYVLSTETGMSWQAQGVGDYNNVLACAFSPFFADDEGICAVVTTGTATAARFSFANTAEGGGWNTDIKDAPITDAKGNPYSSQNASIAFPDDFDPWGIGNNVCFVGTYLLYTATATATAGDVYKIVLKEVGLSSAVDLDIRGVLTTLLPTETDIVSIDVCGDAEEATILVGTDDSDLTSTPAQFLVYYSTDGGETWMPSFKPPTGGVEYISAPDGAGLVHDGAFAKVLMAPDFLTDKIAYAATQGTDTSAFSRTTDGGTSWNQISLIDYGHMTDGYTVAPLGFSAFGYNAEGTLRMTTTAAQGNAVWERTGGKHWERILSYANPAVTDTIDKLSVMPDAIFATDTGATSIWRSSDNGATWPKKITTKAALSAVWFVSPTTIYTGHATGDIYWSTKSGTAWTKPDDNEALGTPIANIGVAGDVVLAGTLEGKVYISSDGGENVKRVGTTNPGDAAQITLATFGFATTDLIYATIVAELQTPPYPPVPVPGAGVWRCEVDFDDPAGSEWVRIDNIQDTTPYDYRDVAAGSPAIALPPSGVLYVVDSAAVVDDDVAGGLWRSTNPTADVDSPVFPYFEKENKGLDANDSLGLLSLDVFPTTLFCSVKNVGPPDGGENLTPYYNQVVMFTDTLDSGVSLADPADKATGVGLLPAGGVKPAVTLAWKAMAGATSYQYQLAYDSDFTSVVASDYTTSLVESFDLAPNKSYYWRVRVANETTNYATIGAPLISPWSETWKFKTVIGAVTARPELEAPEAGFTDVSLTPTFEWSGIEWAEKYEFELATDPATAAGGYFAAPLVALTGANALVSTAWKCDRDLEYSTRYYWHVKAIGVDTETPWSDVGTFTTMAKPVLPPAPPAPVEIPPVQEITPGWIWAIVTIGAVLVIAVIVLIVTTRRAP